MDNVIAEKIRENYAKPEMQERPLAFMNLNATNSDLVTLWLLADAFTEGKGNGTTLAKHCEKLKKQNSPRAMAIRSNLPLAKK